MKNLVQESRQRSRGLRARDSVGRRRRFTRGTLGCQRHGQRHGRFPFRLDLSGDGPSFKGTLFNGDDNETTTSAQHRERHASCSTRALPDEDRRRREKERAARRQGRRCENDKDANGSPFRAVRYVARRPPAAAVPVHRRRLGDSAREPEGREGLALHREAERAPNLQAAILRVDGDTGRAHRPLSGRQVRAQPLRWLAARR